MKKMRNEDMSLIIKINYGKLDFRLFIVTSVATALLQLPISLSILLDVAFLVKEEFALLSPLVVFFD